jgi:DNA-binding NarL/FixJ family response regulator
MKREVVAAALQLVADWLNEQARYLADDSPQGSAAPRREASLAALPAAARLTRREQQVATLIARGLTNVQIAGELVIATSTTERHVANILNKLDMRTRSQIAVWAIECGLGGRAA